MIYEREGSRFKWIQVRVDGQTYRFSSGQKLVGAAKDVESKFRLDLRLHGADYAQGKIKTAEPKPGKTIGDLAQRFLAYSRDQQKCKESTLAFYEERLSLLERSSLGDLPLKEIGRKAIAAWKEKRVLDGVYAVNRDIAVLRAMLRWAYEVEELDVIPVLRRVKGEKAREYVPDWKAVAAYFKAASPALRDVAALMAASGMRPGEIVRLQPKEIDLAEGVINVLSMEPGGKPGKSENARRIVRPFKSVLRILAARVKAGGELVFYDVAGKTPEDRVQNLSTQHAKVRSELGLDPDFVLYSFRHLFGTKTNELPGMDPYTHKAMMGHSNGDDVTAGYVHTSRERILFMARKLESAEVGKRISGLLTA